MIEHICFKSAFTKGSNGIYTQTNYHYQTSSGDYVTEAVNFKEKNGIFFYGAFGESIIMFTDYVHFAVFYQCSEKIPGAYWSYVREGTTADDIEKY